MADVNPDEDVGVYIICYVCEILERWDRHKVSGEPVLVTQRRSGKHEQYFRLANGDRPFQRMIESAISKGFGAAGMKQWLPHVRLIAGWRLPGSGNDPFKVDPSSTPAALDLRSNRTLDIPYKFHLICQPQSLPRGMLIRPASLMRKRDIDARGPCLDDTEPWPQQHNQGDADEPVVPAVTEPPIEDCLLFPDMSAQEGCNQSSAAPPAATADETTVGTVDDLLF